jgi:hypothetical protein
MEKLKKNLKKNQINNNKQHLTSVNHNSLLLIENQNEEIDILNSKFLVRITNSNNKIYLSKASKKRKLSTSTSIDNEESIENDENLNDRMSHTSSIPISNSENEYDFKKKEQEVLSHLSFLKENRKKEMKKSMNKIENDDSETESSSSLTNKDMMAKIEESIQNNNCYLTENTSPSSLKTSFNKGSDSLKQINALLLRPLITMTQAATAVKNVLDLSLPNRSRLATSSESSGNNYYNGILSDYKYPQIFSDVSSSSPLSYTSSNISANSSDNFENKGDKFFNRIKNSQDAKFKTTSKKSSKIKQIEQLEKSLNDLKSKGITKGKVYYHSS